MGAAASTLPPQLDKATARQVAGDRFDEAKFDALAGPSGVVSLTAFLEAGRTHTYDCFLTHDWGQDELGRDNHKRVSAVCAALKQAGYNPWFDEERMRGDINKAMADAIATSACVVVFLTERYIQKASGNGPNGADDNW